MSAFVLIFAFLGSIAGGITLVSTMASAASAPQEAAGAAIALALAVIPYVFARCVQLTASANALKEHQTRVVDRLDSIERVIEKAQAKRD